MDYLIVEEKRSLGRIVLSCKITIFVEPKEIFYKIKHLLHTFHPKKHWIELLWLTCGDALRALSLLQQNFIA